MVALTPDEIARRRPVWDRMADLFLDTETRPDVPFVALTCLESGYSDAELERIWRHEVSPVVAPNLLSVAGEWAGFDLDWLEGRILARRATPLDRMAAWLNRQHFAELMRLLGWLRPIPAPRRHLLARGISKLVWSGLGGSTQDPIAPADHAPGETTRLWDEAAAPLLEALHVKGVDPPLDEILARGRASFGGQETDP